MATEAQAAILEIEDWIRKLEDLEHMEVSELIRKALVDHAVATTTAATDADGRKWAPRKADGGRPLVGALNAVSSYVTDKTAGVKVSGINARHHRGWIRGGVKRGIIPTRSSLPQQLNLRIIKRLSDRFVEIMK